MSDRHEPPRTRVERDEAGSGPVARRVARSPDGRSRGDAGRAADAGLRLVVVIVNYRTPDLAIECLRSLAPQIPTLPGVEVFLADNASGDDSAERIPRAIEREAWDGWARFVALPRNGGFAFGNNAVVREVLAEPNPPDYVLLLNPDTVVTPGAIQPLLDFMEAHPDVGITGSRLDLADGRPQHSCFRFPTLLGQLENRLKLSLASRLLERWAIVAPLWSEPHPTDWVAGASMMVRRQVWEQIGLLDEGYFLYFEEVDFCLRAHRAGWSCWYVPASRVIHYAGASTGMTDAKPEGRCPPYWFASRRRYFVKNHGRGYALAADLVWTLACIVGHTKTWLLGRTNTDYSWLLWDFVRFSFLGGRRRTPEVS